MPSHAKRMHAYGLCQSTEVRADVSSANDQCDATLRAQRGTLVLPAVLSLVETIPAEILHHGPHHGEHVLSDTTTIGTGGVGDHDSMRQHAWTHISIHTGAERLQPFQTLVLPGIAGREIADNSSGLGTQFLGNAGWPHHVPTAGFVTNKFLRHIARRLGERLAFGLVQWQAIDNQLMRILDPHGSPT